MTSAHRRYIPYAIVGLLAIGGIANPGVTGDTLQAAAAWFLLRFDWLTLLTAGLSVVLCFVIAVLPVGARRIGGADARPEFRTTTWLAMLFATGMGAGLVFWGAAEPLIFTLSPPPDGAAAGSAAARRDALALTQFHWAIHAWSVYAVAALAVAIAARTRAPLPSSPFPEAPRRLRRLIDWTALFAVIFGVVASVGQGVMQMEAGVVRLTGSRLEGGPWLQLLILGTLAAAYMASAAAGLRRGIAVLSNVNIIMAITLAAFVFLVGPTLDIIRTLFESIGAYAEAFFRLSTSLREEGPARSWTRDWSLTYFLWWIAWTPFVGVFIARISHGRRIRDFVLGVVVVPVLATFLWFSIFGGTALNLEAQGIGLGVDNFETAPEATYAMLEHLPLTALAQLVTFLLVFIFIMTSADSGAFVLGMFASGSADPSRRERLFWGGVIAVLTAAALLSAGGQSVTRAFAVSGAVPLTLLLLAQGLVTARRRFHGPQQQVPDARAGAGANREGEASSP
jgi:choline/carnitine/betaine transport